MLPDGVAVNSLQFEMESWTGAQRAFPVNSFYKNNDSYVAAQREFRKKFGIHLNSKMPSAHAIKMCVNNFEETGSTVKKKGGNVKTVRIPQNIDAVRASFEQSPRRSVVRHSKELEVRKQCQAYFTLGFALRMQEEISRIPVDVLRIAMSSVHVRLTECEQRNGGHLEDVMSGMMCCVFLFSFNVSRPLIHLFLQMLKYVLPYKCNCIMISNTFNFLTLKIARFTGGTCMINSRTITSKATLMIPDNLLRIWN